MALPPLRSHGDRIEQPLEARVAPPVPTSAGPMLAVAGPEAPQCSSSLGPENPRGPPALETALQGRREQGLDRLG